MIKKILLVLLALVAIILIVAAFQPDSYVIERTATIAVAPEVVFAHVTDQRDWQRSNPWILEDPTAKAEFSGAASGVGSVYSWTGDDVGSGTAKIVEARPYSYAKAALEFYEPFEDKATDEYILEPSNGGTKIIHRMSGNNNYIAKLMGLFMSMDDMIGGKFETEFLLMSKNLASAAK